MAKIVEQRCGCENMRPEAGREHVLSEWTPISFCSRHDDQARLLGGPAEKLYRCGECGFQSQLWQRMERHVYAFPSGFWGRSAMSLRVVSMAQLRLEVLLALAATMPSTAWGSVDGTPSFEDDPGSELSGIWRSTYTFFSSRRNREIESEHFLVLRHSNGRLVGQSLPHTTGSRLSLDLAVEKPVVTGTWLEHTSPVGYYAGATYHGTLQMFVDPLGRTMKGKWLGFGKNFEINTGDWQLTWVEGSTSKQAQRRYHMKA